MPRKYIEHYLAHRITILLIIMSVAICAGCQSPPKTPINKILAGEYGRARVKIARNLSEDRSDRRYLLDRMSLGILTLADGYPLAAQPIFEDIYQVLRTQGINRDKTIEAVVLNEDLKFWKGEPFEQAFAMLYYGVQQAQLGQWDNARAALNSSLFRLKDFGDDEEGKRINTYEIAKRALDYEKKLAAEKAGDKQDQSEDHQYLNSGYAARESNFVLGYLLNGLANLQLNRDREAMDHLAAAIQIDPTVKPVCDRLRTGQYNTVLLVSFGLGPQKIGYGPDDAIAGFEPRFPSEDQPLIVRVNEQRDQAFPLVCDVNAMALDHMWNNLEDVRLAKSYLGNVLIQAGFSAVEYGVEEDSDAVLYAGIGAVVVGAILTSGAHADTRHCEVLPQRYYLVPLTLPPGDPTIELEIQDQPQSRLLLTGLRQPNQAGSTPLRYVRLVSRGQSAPKWATSGHIYYSNDQTGTVQGDQYPYVLGGNCVRYPSNQSIRSYQQSGFLQSSTTNDLKEVYRKKGVRIDITPIRQSGKLHILEGGRSMATPLVGTTGFARLFGQEHRRYKRGEKKYKEMTRPMTVIDSSVRH